MAKQWFELGPLTYKPNVLPLCYSGLTIAYPRRVEQMSNFLGYGGNLRELVNIQSTLKIPQWLETKIIRLIRLLLGQHFKIVKSTHIRLFEQCVVLTYTDDDPHICYWVCVLRESLLEWSMGRDCSTDGVAQVWNKSDTLQKKVKLDYFMRCNRPTCS